MTDEPRDRKPMTAEEIEEKVRQRKQRTRWGSILAVIGLGGGLAAIFWKDDFVSASILLLVGLVGAGFMDPSALKTVWRSQ